MAARTVPSRPKAYQPTFEFVDGAPLSAEQKKAARTKVRSNARKWQAAAKRNAASPDVFEAVEGPAQLSPYSMDTLNGYSLAWEPDLDVSDDLRRISSPNDSQSSASTSNVTWNGSASSQTSREPSPIEQDPEWALDDALDFTYAEAHWALGPSLPTTSQALISWPTGNLRPEPTPGWIREVAVEESRSAPSLVDFLGAGRVDPFATYPSKLSSSLVGKYIDVLVRGPLRSATGGKAALRAPTAFIGKAMSNPMLFHTLMFSAASYNLASQGILNRDGPQDLVYSEGEAIKYVNKQISNPKTACADETIHTVLFLANIGIDPTAKRGDFRAPRQGPLKELQCLNVYGTYEMRPAHRRGLVTLLNMRGGLDTFGPNRLLPGLICYVDIMGAILLLTKPTLPYVSLTKGVNNFNLDVPAGWFGQPRLSLQDLAHGFERLWQRSISSVPDLLRIIDDMRHFTIVLDKYHDKLGELDLTLMADHRNSIQYRLMELPETADCHDRASESIFRCCRLGALIYCLIVVFPYPASKAPFDQLAARLRSEMMAEDFPIAQSPKVSLWLTFMGGLAALGCVKERVWFAQALRTCLRGLQLSTWSEAKKNLSCYLWYERVSDGDGRNFFREAGALISSGN